MLTSETFQRFSFGHIYSSKNIMNSESNKMQLKKQSKISYKTGISLYLKFDGSWVFITPANMSRYCSLSCSVARRE